MGKKSRYSPAAWQRRLMRNREYTRERAAKKRANSPVYGLGHEQREARPPPEVLLERDHRIVLASLQSTEDIFTGIPPRTYAAAYYVKAWRMQRRFARGESA